MSERNPCSDPSRRFMLRTQRQVDKPFHQVYLCLGSNIHPEANLPKAVDLLCELVGVEAVSHAWETPPEGMKGPNFLNAMVRITTPLSRNLLKSLVLRRIEVQLGRRRTSNKYMPRTIDLDLILFDGQLLEPKLWKLGYLAVPLAELLPDHKNPETQETLAEAAERFLKHSSIRRRDDVKLFEPVR